MDFNNLANMFSMGLAMIAIYLCTVETILTSLRSSNKHAACYMFKVGLGIGILAIAMKCWTVLPW